MKGIIMWDKTDLMIITVSFYSVIVSTSSVLGSVVDPFSVYMDFELAQFYIKLTDSIIFKFAIHYFSL